MSNEARWFSFLFAGLLGSTSIAAGSTEAARQLARHEHLTVHYSCKFELNRDLGKWKNRANLSRQGKVELVKGDWTTSEGVQWNCQEETGSASYSAYGRTQLEKGAIVATSKGSGRYQPPASEQEPGCSGHFGVNFETGTWSFGSPTFDVMAEKRKEHPSLPPEVETEEQDVPEASFSNQPLSASAAAGFQVSLESDPFNLYFDAGRLSHSDMEFRYQCSIGVQPGNPSELKANAGADVKVERGQRASLDASGSTGKITSWEWRFSSDCGTRPGAKKTGRQVTVDALCPFTATLTVTDRDGQTATDKIRVEVTPRKWDTSFQTLEKLESMKMHGLSSRAPIVQASGQLILENGINICECHHEEHTLHPGAKADGSWEGSGYALAQVSDPGGPFDGHWYVKERMLKVSRLILVNSHLLPDAPRPFAAGALRPNFHDGNLAHKNEKNLKAFFKALEEHEGNGWRGKRPVGHSSAMKKALEKHDPGPRLEPLMGSSREEVSRKADRLLVSAERALCEASSDGPRMPVLFKGTLFYLEEAGPRWSYEPKQLVVGGGNYGRARPCK